MRQSFALAMVLVMGATLAFGADKKPPQPPPPVAISGPTFAVTSVGTVTATPATITFSAPDPDLSPSVAGSSTATVTWSTSGGASARIWSLTVLASGTSFTGCGTVPATAVTVTCRTAGVNGGGGTGACSGSFALSTAAQQVASGAEGGFNRSYTVTINFTLADSWRYVADSCPLTLTYIVNAP